MLASVDNGRILGLGVSAPGPVDMSGGVLLCSPGRADWTNVPLKQVWQDRLNIPVFVGNDANLGALGEHRFGAGRGIESMVYVTVSTGVGGGIVPNGNLLDGATGLAGEIGHMTLLPQGPRCGCGNLGCLEALASGRAIAGAAVSQLREGRESMVRELVQGQLERVSSEVVARAAKQGDQMAVELLGEAGRYLGIALANLVHLVNPQRIVLGGGVAKAGPSFLTPVVREVELRTMDVFNGSFEIVLAELGDDAPMLGAVTMVADASE